MNEKHLGRKRLRLEALEDRSLLAGDVMVQVVDGSLMVVGDKFDNALTLSQGDAIGDFVIQGRNDAHGNATKINGVANGAITFHDVTKDVLISLMQGDDELLVDRAQIVGNLTIRTGVGNDSVTLGNPSKPAGAASGARPDLLYPVTIGGNLVVELGDGNDQLSQAGVTVAGDESIKAGAGQDHIRLGVLDSSPAAVVEEPSVHVAGNLAVDLGRGDDTFDAQSLAVGKSLNLFAVTGKQQINLNTIDVVDRLTLITGTGEDTITAANVMAKSLVISTGQAVDHVGLFNVQVSSLVLFLGEGDDSFHAVSVYADLGALLFGGKGFDTYLEGAGPQPGIVSPRFRHISVEQIIPLD